MEQPHRTDLPAGMTITRPLVPVIAGIAFAALGGLMMATTDMSCYHDLDEACLGDNGMPGGIISGIAMICIGGLFVLVGLIAFAVQRGGAPTGSSMAVATKNARHARVESEERDDDGQRDSRLDRLSRLAELRRQGALSDEEFEGMKKEILG